MSSLRVVKVGGSLLDLPDLKTRLQRALAEPVTDCNLLVPGGGALADCLRRYDATFGFETHFIHQVAIETMRITARLLAKLLDAPLVSDLPEDRRLPLAVLDVETLLKREPAGEGTKLKSDWSVTSDSISARIATMLQAEELWLLKSVPEGSADAEQLAHRGVVDPQFPVYARNVRWRVLNLREMGG